MHVSILHGFSFQDSVSYSPHSSHTPFVAKPAWTSDPLVSISWVLEQQARNSLFLKQNKTKQTKNPCVVLYWVYLCSMQPSSSRNCAMTWPWRANTETAFKSSSGIGCSPQVCREYETRFSQSECSPYWTTVGRVSGLNKIIEKKLNTGAVWAAAGPGPHHDGLCPPTVS